MYAIICLCYYIYIYVFARFCFFIHEIIDIYKIFFIVLANNKYNSLRKNLPREKTRT